MGKKKASSSSHKQLEQDIIDLTLADSDEVESQRVLRNACIIGSLLTLH